MKVLVVLSAVFALCATNAIPKDNSHYVEGESRYVWITDADDNQVLVDLHEPVSLTEKSGANNQYWLFTRSNPTNRQVLVNGNAASVTGSNYNGGRLTFVLVHGWTNNGNHPMNTMIRPALLNVYDCNVIVVDWNGVAGQSYVNAVNGVPNVGQHLGNFLTFLVNTAGGNWNNFHLIGFSLGAHVVASAGRSAAGNPGRITGLDPAGPLWISNSNRLTSNAGQYVEGIHTDGGLQGIFNPVGHADFYPNRGRNPQPGCSNSGCSHDMAWQIFASSVTNNRFVGRLCSNIAQAENGQCTGSTFNMGNGVSTKRGSGLYGLTTLANWPHI